MLEMKSTVIQRGVFWEDGELLSNREAASRYFNVVDVTDEEVMSARFAADPSYLMRGSMTLAQKMGRKFDFARVDRWLPHFREYAVNRDAIFTDMQHALDFLLREEDISHMFVRPASPLKEFAGQAFNADSLAKEMNWLKQGKNIEPRDLLCVVAPTVQIEREWRCIFVEGRLAGGSQYMTRGEADIRADLPKEVGAFASQLARHDYFLNKFEFVIDVGEVAGALRLVEVNGFETASFYAANLDEIYDRWAKSLTGC